MIEVEKTYDVLPGIDQQAYLEFSRRALATMAKSPGLVEIRASRSLLGAPHVRLTVVWQSLADWAVFAESPDRFRIDSELLTFATNEAVQLWGSSPVVPEPIHPSK